MAWAVSTGLKRCRKHPFGPLFWRYFKGRERFITAEEFFFSQNGLALLYNDYDIHLKLSECNEHKTSFIATRVKTLFFIRIVKSQGVYSFGVNFGMEKA